MESTEQREAALRRLRDAAKKSKRTGHVPFPPGFVRVAADGHEATSPLARLIQGGRGGEVRLKLYLCITMMAAGHPFDLRKPPTPIVWARTLGLADTTGPRRVSTALRWLEDSKFIAREKRLPGEPPKITLLDANGGGGKYVPPRSGGRYVGMPIELWTEGWLLDLSATGLALLFVLRELLGGHTTSRYVTKSRRGSYGLSHDTWTKATKELVGFGLLKVTRTPQGDDFTYQRMRNSYTLNLEHLKASRTQITA